MTATRRKQIRSRAAQAEKILRKRDTMIRCLDYRIPEVLAAIRELSRQAEEIYNNL